VGCLRCGNGLLLDFVRESTDTFLSKPHLKTTLVLSSNPLLLPSSKHFLTALGHTGLNNLLAAYADKSATAVCTFAFCAGPGEEPILFQGRTEGRIVPARGPPNFGWDPIFEVGGKTYAEMEKGEKVSCSNGNGCVDGER
jgi:hypothetical protein